MKLRILTAVLALTMVIVCLGSAQAEPYKLINTYETKEFNKDIVNHNPARYDTTVMMQPGSQLIMSLADIVLDADRSYRDFKSYTALDADRATANIGGDIYTNINILYPLTEINGAALEASNLTVNEIIAYVTSTGSLPKNDKTYVSLLKFFANRSTNNFVNAGNLVGEVNTKGSNVVRGIDSSLLMKDTTQTFDLTKGISLDSYSSDGSVEVIGMALDASDVVYGPLNVNISAAGNIMVAGKSDGTDPDASVSVTGFSNAVSPTADFFTPSLVLNLQDIIANAISKNDADSTAVELFGASGTDNTVTATLPGKLVSSATTVSGPSYARALFINNENVTAKLDAPDNAQVLASALASQAVSDATALLLTGGNITVSGNRDATARAVGLDSYATAISASGVPDNISSVSMKNLLSDAAAKNNAEATGIFADNANVSVDGITVDSVVSGSDISSKATSTGIDADANAIVASNGAISVFSDGLYAQSTGVLADNSAIINVFGDTTVTASSPKHANATGVKSLSGYPNVDNITVSSQSPIYSLAVGVSASTEPGGASSSTTRVTAKNVDVTAAGGSPNAYGVVSEGSGSDVTVDKIKSTIIKEGSNAVGKNVGALVKNGAHLTVNDDIIINTGTGLETDNTARVQVSGSVQADDLFEGGKVIDMTVKPGVSPLPIVIGGASVIYGGDLLHLTADGFADEDEFLDAVPMINIGKLYLVDNLNDVIRGTLNGKPIDSNTVGRLVFDKFDNLNINYLFGWEPSGDHYTIDYMNTDNLEYEAEYDVYTGTTGTDVDFHITTDPGYAVTEIATGGYTDAVPMEEEGWYYVTIPGANGVYITVKVSKTVYAALQRWYFYGMDPETKERAYWLCTKVGDGKAKLISLNGFEKTPDDFIESWLSKEEQENLKSDGYYLDPELSENIFADGLEHPVIEANVFYIGY